MQTCKSCGEEKPLSAFYPAKENKLGVKSRCKSCELKRLKEKRLAAKNAKGRISLPSQESLLQHFDYINSGGLRVKTGSNGHPAGKITHGVGSGNGYRVISLNGVRYRLHRLIWKMHYNSEPEYIDHINHNRGDNRIENLRVVTREENARHQVAPKNNTSGFIGVSFHYKSWVALILHNGERIRIGRFSNIKDAVLAYNEKCNELHGEFGKSKIIHNMEELKRRGLI
jgi:hypothetical protein